MSDIISQDNKISEIFYSTKEILSLTGLKKAQFNHILKYLNMDIPVKIVGKRRFYTFNQNNLDTIKNFIESHNNITQFFREQTTLNHYGVSNPSQSEEIKNKKKQTCMHNFGVDCNFKSDETKNKIKETCLKKYGCENANQSNEIKKKKINTCLMKYGVENPLQSNDVKQKITNTCLEKYGVDWAASSQVVKDKISNTINNKFGVNSYFQTNDFKEKTKQTLLEKYGVENPLKSSMIQSKIKNTMVERYGVENPNQSEEIRKRAIETHRKKISVIENTKNLTQVNKLLNLYGQGWYVYLNIPKIKIDGVSYVENIYLDKIKNHFENSINGISYTEKDVLDYIRSIYSGLVIENDKTVIKPKELDIYIPDKKLAVEFNGNYWHSQERGVDKKYHENKSKLCEEKGIRLIHIYECEWQYQQEKIKSLLRLALGVGYSKIGARKCEVRKITNKEAKPFNDKNHLQNHRNAQVTYGLYFNNELQQLMSFSHNNKYEWEIIRGCPGSNNQVVGGVSKLFKAFVKEYNPNSVFSYCDFNKFDGRGYEALGMKFIGYTGYDKFYIDKSGCKVNRNPHKRKELEESCLYTIYGAGSKKYLWSKI